MADSLQWLELVVAVAVVDTGRRLVVIVIVVVVVVVVVVGPVQAYQVECNWKGRSQTLACSNCSPKSNPDH